MLCPAGGRSRRPHRFWATHWHTVVWPHCQRFPGVATPGWAISQDSGGRKRHQTFTYPNAEKPLQPTCQHSLSLLQGYQPQQQQKQRWWLLCADSYCAEPAPRALHSLSNRHSQQPFGSGFLLLSLYRGKNQGSECSSNLPKVTQLWSLGFDISISDQSETRFQAPALSSKPEALICCLAFQQFDGYYPRTQVYSSGYL